MAMLVDYGIDVTTATDAVVFLLVFVPISYAIFVLFAVALNRVW